MNSMSLKTRKKSTVRLRPKRQPALTKLLPNRLRASPRRTAERARICRSPPSDRSLRFVPDAHGSNAQDITGGHHHHAEALNRRRLRSPQRPGGLSLGDSPRRMSLAAASAGKVSPMSRDLRLERDSSRSCRPSECGAARGDRGRLRLRSGGDLGASFGVALGGRAGRESRWWKRRARCRLRQRSAPFLVLPSASLRAR